VVPQIELGFHGTLANTVQFEAGVNFSPLSKIYFTALVDLFLVQQKAHRTVGKSLPGRLSQRLSALPSSDYRVVRLLEFVDSFS